MISWSPPSTAALLQHHVYVVVAYLAQCLRMRLHRLDQPPNLCLVPGRAAAAAAAACSNNIMIRTAHQFNGKVGESQSSMLINSLMSHRIVTFGLVELRPGRKHGRAQRPCSATAPGVGAISCAKRLSY
jgi:hypothetical protein